jgi:predicted CoA-binding protein
VNVKDSEIKGILERYGKITVIGLQPDESKPSHTVPAFMRSQGYKIVGVYPKPGDFAGFKIYQSLMDVPPEFRKFVNVFRRPEAIPAVVNEVLAVGGVEVLFLQLGITHPQAEQKAEAAGLKVISNRCLYIEYEKWRPLPVRN